MAALLFWLIALLCLLIPLVLERRPQGRRHKWITAAIGHHLRR